MKSDVHKFNESYYQELLKLPRKDLAKIIHKKQTKMLKNIYTTEPNTTLINEIDTILKKCIHHDKPYFLAELYIATLGHVFWMHENNHKEKTKNNLITAINHLLIVETLKIAIDIFKQYNTTQNPKQYQTGINLLEEIIKKQLLYPDKVKYLLSDLKDVITGDKMEWEIYNSKEHLDQVESLGYGTFTQIYGDIYQDVYQDEATFTNLSHDKHKHLKHILTKYLNNDIQKNQKN